jgi:DsbC/DsbD-like thiol-disulfide interchange protein
MPSLRRRSTRLAFSLLVLSTLALTAAAADGAAADGGEAGSEVFRSPRTVVQLVAEERSARAGEPVRVGLRFDLAEQWHVYWRNPGDSGTAPSVTWKLPEGWSAGEFQWPVPARIPVGPFVNFGYAGEIVLPVLLEPGSPEPAPDRLRVVADAEWLVCREECIPESARFTLELPVTREAPAPSAWAPLFADADSRQPVEMPGVESTIRDLGDGTLELELRYPADLELAGAELELFPVDPSAVEHAAKVEIDAGGEGDERRLTLTLQRSPFAGGEVRRLDGVLVARSREPRDERSVALAIAARPPDAVDAIADAEAPALLEDGAETESAAGSVDADLEWLSWTPELVASLRAGGRPVYVDFTARWCLICQANKRVVFGSRRVVRELVERGVALVRADWTDQDPRITAALEAHGRSGVPLNLYYPADADAPPTVLPAVLSPDIVLRAIRSSSDSRSPTSPTQATPQGDSR